MDQLTKLRIPQTVLNIDRPQQHLVVQGLDSEKFIRSCERDVNP